MTHLNAPRLRRTDFPQPGQAPKAKGLGLLPLQDDIVRYCGQHIGVVVADTFERATHAAQLIRVQYDEQQSKTDFAANLSRAIEPSGDLAGQPVDSRRGDVQRALAAATVRVEQTYTIATEHHNPMAPGATVAVWDGPQLTIYDASQWVQNVRRTLAQMLAMPEANIRVFSKFVGGAFGCYLRAWPHIVLAAVAARYVKRPVKLVLTREQMYTSVGFRTPTISRITLGAARDGRLLAMKHEGFEQTSTFDEWTEALTRPTQTTYACPNVETSFRIVPLNVHTPSAMRAPGESQGTFALESTLDELAYELKLDPVELRLRNYAERDPQTNERFSSKALRECYREGASRIGWGKRNPEPRSMSEGRYLIGIGMAGGMYPMLRRPASATARILSDGSAVVQSSTIDMGMGTYTSMTIIASDALGLAPERVRFQLGDSAMPPTPLTGGSMTVASVGSAVHEACLVARGKIVSLAQRDSRSPLFGLREEDVVSGDGHLLSKIEPGRGETYAAILLRNGLKEMEATVESKAAANPDPRTPSGGGTGQGPRQENFSMQIFAAQFALVRVDPELGEVRVARHVSVIGAGRIINPKTARSQIVGGVTQGIGMALMEETVMDHRFGRYVNANLGEYHVPVNADVPTDIDVHFIEEQDTHVNPLGAKGIGEIALIGVAPAIANAVYHATGKRIRDLPITLDKLL